MDVQYQCPSCFEDFATEPNQDLTPVMGIGSAENPCGHNVCNACVLQIQVAEIQEKRRQVVNVKCPVCREPSFNAKVRAPNRGLMGALLYIKQQKKVSESTKRTHTTITTVAAIPPKKDEEIAVVQNEQYKSEEIYTPEVHTNSTTDVDSICQEKQVKKPFPTNTDMSRYGRKRKHVNYYIEDQEFDEDFALTDHVATEKNNQPRKSSRVQFAVQLGEDQDHAPSSQSLQLTNVSSNGPFLRRTSRRWKQPAQQHVTTTTKKIYDEYDNDSASGNNHSPDEDEHQEFPQEAHQEPPEDDMAPAPPIPEIVDKHGDENTGGHNLLDEDAVHQDFPQEVHQEPPEDDMSPVPPIPEIKTEPIHHHRKTAQHHRKYGDRVLLARQAENGMMKLGGRNATMFLWPKDMNHPRYKDIGDRKCMAYNDIWNGGAPKYAGQPFAHVTRSHTGETFSVFVKRTVNQQCLGWEYCGEYRSEEDTLAGTQAAHTVPAATKNCILAIILASFKRPNGDWKTRIEIWREQIAQWCDEDPSPAGPKWLVDGHDGPRSDEEAREKASSAARARALGFSVDMSQEQLAKLLVAFDPFYESSSIEFVYYDEEIYNYVKAGKTTKNYLNKSRKKGTDERTRAAAKASDWYAIYDTYLGNG